ncbi:hypothetical protein Tco_1160447 [Tanacetum coccineum]
MSNLLFLKTKRGSYPLFPFVLENPLTILPLPVVDSDFLIEEVDTFLVSEDSIPPGIKSDFDSEEDIILDDLLNDDPIPEGGEIVFIKMFIDAFLHIYHSNFSAVSHLLVDSSFNSLHQECRPFLTPAFHDYPDFEDSRAHGFVHSYIRASYPQLHLGDPISKSYRLTFFL